MPLLAALITAVSVAAEPSAIDTTPPCCTTFGEQLIAGLEGRPAETSEETSRWLINVALANATTKDLASSLGALQVVCHREACPDRIKVGINTVTNLVPIRQREEDLKKRQADRFTNLGAAALGAMCGWVLGFLGPRRKS